MHESTYCDLSCDDSSIQRLVIDSLSGILFPGEFVREYMTEFAFESWCGICRFVDIANTKIIHVSNLTVITAPLAAQLVCNMVNGGVHWVHYDNEHNTYDIGIAIKNHVLKYGEYQYLNGDIVAKEKIV